MRDSLESVASSRSEMKLSEAVAASALQLASNVGCDEVEENSEMSEGCEREALHERDWKSSWKQN